MTMLPVSVSFTGPEPEDAFSFTAAIFGALGSTIQQQNNPKTLLFGLVFAAFAKSLPSLGQSLSDPSKKADRREDLMLFGAAFLAAFGAGIQSNFTFSTPESQEILIFGLAIGLIGKALPSLRGGGSIIQRKWTVDYEDIVPVIGGVAAIVTILPLGAQYASVGIFFGFLGKQLLSTSPTTGAPPPSAPAPPAHNP